MCIASAGILLFEHAGNPVVLSFLNDQKVGWIVWQPETSSINNFLNHAELPHVSMVLCPQIYPELQTRPEDQSTRIPVSPSLDFASYDEELAMEKE